MARQRMINPTFFQDDDVAMLSPWARLLFINLWCLADREGRLEDKPGRIKAQTFPYDNPVDIDGNLKELVEQGFVIRYVVDGRKYIQIKNFAKHQRPHHKEAPSTLPGPAPESPGKVRASTDPAPTQHAPNPPEYGIRNTESDTESESVDGALSPAPLTDAQRQSYVGACWASLCERRKSEFPQMSSADFDTALRWIEAGIPLQVAIRGIADCSKPPPSFRYVDPAVREAFGMWKKAMVGAA